MISRFTLINSQLVKAQAVLLNVELNKMGIFFEKSKKKCAWERVKLFMYDVPRIFLFFFFKKSAAEGTCTLLAVYFVSVLRIFQLLDRTAAELIGAFIGSRYEL